MIWGGGGGGGREEVVNLDGCFRSEFDSSGIDIDKRDN